MFASIQLATRASATAAPSRATGKYSWKRRERNISSSVRTCKLEGLTKYAHRRTHTGKRPYRCPFDDCTKSFVRKTMLTKHMKHDHATNGKRPSVQWRPFLEERRMVQQQQQYAMPPPTVAAAAVGQCSCYSCWSAASSSTAPALQTSPLLSSPSSSVDSMPSSPTSWSPVLHPSYYRRTSSSSSSISSVSSQDVVLPSVSSFFDRKDDITRRNSSYSLFTPVL